MLVSLHDRCVRQFGIAVNHFPAQVQPFSVYAVMTDGLGEGTITLGVTQLESTAMRHLIIQMRPEQFEDIVQALALVRPWAEAIGVKAQFVRRRRGLEPRQPLHPRLVALLGLPAARLEDLELPWGAAFAPGHRTLPLPPEPLFPRIEVPAA